MGIPCWITVVAASALIVAHGLFPTGFTVDSISILALFILSIPCLANFLKSAKLFGAEFDFKDNIQVLSNMVDVSKKKTTITVHGDIQTAPTSTVSTPPSRPPTAKARSHRLPGGFRGVVFDVGVARAQLDSDPTLALAALRMEMERALKSTAHTLGFKTPKRANIRELADLISKVEGVLSFDDVNALHQAVAICNAAIHGGKVEKEEAVQVIELISDLNQLMKINKRLFKP